MKIEISYITQLNFNNNLSYYFNAINSKYMLFIHISSYNIHKYLKLIYFCSMNGLPSIEELRCWFLEMKKKYGWTYRELSKITYYTESGIREAIKKNTITYDAITQVINGKNLIHEYKTHFMLVDYSLIQNQELLGIISQRKKEIFEDSVFKDIFTAYNSKKSTNKNPT